MNSHVLMPLTSFSKSLVPFDGFSTERQIMSTLFFEQKTRKQKQGRKTGDFALVEKPRDTLDYMKSLSSLLSHRISRLRCYVLVL